MTIHIDRRMLWALGAVVVAAVVGLATGWASAAQVITVVAVLACPIMMLFMMGGMHGEGAGSAGCHGQHAAQDDQARTETRPITGGPSDPR